MSPSTHLTLAIFCSGISTFPVRSKAMIYEAMVPLFSSDLRAMIIESFEPGRNLNDENP